MWSSSPARTLVIACSDGRIWRALDVHLAVSLGVSAYDRLCLPGGPAALFRRHGENRSVAAREALDFLARSHSTNRIICVFHGGADKAAACGDYARRPGEPRQAQLADASALLTSVKLAGLRPEILFAAVTKTGWLRFTQFKSDVPELTQVAS